MIKMADRKTLLVLISWLAAAAFPYSSTADGRAVYKLKSTADPDTELNERRASKVRGLAKCILEERFKGENSTYQEVQEGDYQLVGLSAKIKNRRVNVWIMNYDERIAQARDTVAVTSFYEGQERTIIDSGMDGNYDDTCTQHLDDVLSVPSALFSSRRALAESAEEDTEERELDSSFQEAYEKDVVELSRFCR